MYRSFNNLLDPHYKQLDCKNQNILPDEDMGLKDNKFTLKNIPVTLEKITSDSQK